MAKKIENKKGFLVIEMTVEEAINKCMFGHNDEIICDNCNKDMVNPNDVIYYVAVLNMAFCKDCLDEFIERQDRFEEDADVEAKNYEFIADMVGIPLQGTN